MIKAEQNIVIATQNELIAKFMGVKETKGFYDSYGIQTPHYYTGNGICRSASYSVPDKSFDDFIKHLAKYHTSWDWLMPVVEKIESMGFETLICSYSGQYMNILHNVSVKDATVENPTKTLGTGNTKIQAVYTAVLSFITWHNENDKLK